MRWLGHNLALDPYWERIVALGVESTFNGYWFVDGLRDQGRNVKLGNPARMEQYRSIKITNDLSDADWLAEQLRLGIFPECYVYPKETRPVRDALRRRQLFEDAGFIIGGTITSNYTDSTEYEAVFYRVSVEESIE